MPSKPKYQCPRCGYETERKSNMNKHFHNKKTCPACFHDIELTTEVKTHVLENRLYKANEVTPQINQNTIHNIVNQYNVFTNIINKMDPVHKVNKYVTYKNMALVNFEQSIENKMARNIRRFQEGSMSNYTLDRKTIVDIIDKLTAFKDIEHINLIYDVAPGQLKIFQCGTWKPYTFHIGVEIIVDAIKSSYLDHYEYYMLKKFYITANYREKQECIESLEEYYRFLAAFDLQPAICGCSDHIVLDNGHEDVFTLETKFMPIYKNVLDGIRYHDVRQIKQRVYDVIKMNSKASNMELNKQLMELIKMDEHFKNSLLLSLSICSE